MSKKILVLEDEKEIGELYVKCLQDHGFEAVLACNGFEGIEKLKTMEPDLILLDLGMPQMNGIEFYHHLCGTKKEPRFPVLVLTGRGDLEMLFKDFQLEGFIIKPFRSSQLLQEVEIVFNKQNLKQEENKRVIVVDDNEFAARAIMNEFTKAGYRSELARSGVSGVERIVDDPPELAVVKLGLTDISGDLVILRLQRIAKTKGVKFVLYTEKNHAHDKIVFDNFSQKSGVRSMCEYGKPEEVVEVALRVAREESQDLKGIDITAAPAEGLSPLEDFRRKIA